MKVHREGYSYIATSGILVIMSAAIYFMSPNYWKLIFFLGASLFFLFSLQFFRYPNRPQLNVADDLILCPADGKVVVIEKINERQTQISIFMSPLNIHANWVPVKGRVTKAEHKPGKYLVAWNPKSSQENERFESIIRTDFGNYEVIATQIAGAMARRIVNYLSEQDKVNGGDELGFIKFGSRVDLIIPSESEIFVELNDQVKGNMDLIARLPRI